MKPYMTMTAEVCLLNDKLTTCVRQDLNLDTNACFGEFKGLSADFLSPLSFLLRAMGAEPNPFSYEKWKPLVETSLAKFQKDFEGTLLFCHLISVDVDGVTHVNKDIPGFISSSHATIYTVDGKIALAERVSSIISPYFRLTGNGSELQIVKAD